MLGFENLIDLKSDSISSKVYTDPQVYQAELETVFAKSWLLLGHESQIPQPGNFFSSYMGEDPVIMVRQRDGSIAAFLNQCRHRGMKVCRSDIGSTRSFLCPYHGWSYDLAGELRAVPHEEQYGSNFDKKQWSLRRVPRLEVYKGLVLANWDPDALDLVEYLAGSAYYLDCMVDRLEGGSEVIGGVHKWTVNCNWKMPAEQAASDMYHAGTAHVSAVQAFAADGYDPKLHSMDQRDGAQYWTPGGHGGGYFFAERPNPAIWLDPLAKKWLSDTFEDAKKRIGPDRAARVSGHNTVFPNMSWLVGTNTLRVWHPRGPNKTEIWAWVVVDRAAPPEVKDAFRRGALRSFGPSGMLEQDDGENWGEMQKVMQGAQGSKTSLCYGMAPDARIRDIEGVNAVHGPVFSDAAARNFYSHWLSMLTGRQLA